MITFRNLGRLGRLGNALFQLASTIGIGARLNEPVILPADWIHRPYFSVPDELFGPIPAEAHEATEYVPYIDERARPYLQDISLFRNEMDRVREYLFPSRLALEELDKFALPEHPRIAVHVRRGDNVIDPGVPNKADYHPCPPASYYLEAASLLPDGRRMVFSDDLAWCRESLPFTPYGCGQAHPKEHEPDYFSAVPRDWIDLFMMARCDYFVLSNSTFGIWAALLANVPPDHVIRPTPVYGPLLQYIDEALMFDPDWKALRVT